MDNSKVPTKCCVTCSYYSALREPRKRSDNAVIYGYCFKDGDHDYNTNMGKGYPIFISGGVCKQFKKEAEMMDAKYLAEIKAREQAATKGPWKDDITDIWLGDRHIAEVYSASDAVFIAAARTDIPALLAEVERLMVENEKMKPFYKIADDTFKHWENAAYAMRDEECARNAAKDQQIATLKKALELACDSRFRYMPKPDYFIRQAQEQEENDEKGNPKDRKHNRFCRW